MAKVISIRRAAQDNWQLLEDAAGGVLPVAPAGGDVIVPLALWQRDREILRARSGRLGVWLKCSEDPQAIAGDLAHFHVIAVHFPKFTDGRGYSTARLLRDRHGWRGELRAIGDVQRDQLLYLLRCGFDAFALKEGQDVQEAMRAFGEFGEAYQASIERPVPLFRRRNAGARPSTGSPWHHAAAR